MLTFFRGIRRGLLSSAWTSKYLLYAVGEIALVVMGILIALQINNWNEDRITRKEERIILISIQSEFKENTVILNEAINEHRRIARHCKSFVDHCKPNPETIPADSLRKLIRDVIMLARYYPNTGAITSIISSGDISMIENDDLKHRLNSWQASLGKYDYSTDLMQNNVRQSIKPIVAKLYPLQDIRWWNLMEEKAIELSVNQDMGRFTYSQEQLFTNMELASHFEMKRIDSEDAVERSIVLQELQAEILDLIESELSKGP